MTARALATALVSTVLLIAGATVAQADDFALCPGVHAASAGAYVLTQDATCDLRLLADDTRVDLAGHTLTAADPRALLKGARVTITHGKLRSNSIFWQGGYGRLDDVDVAAIDPVNATGFFIEAWGNLTVIRSRFHDMPNATAIDFYYGNVGSVTQSTFTRTRIGVSVQLSSDIVIKNNRFESNTIGVQLWNENHGGLNNITVAQNTITDSASAGIRVLNSQWRYPTFANNQITGNRVVRSGASGIDITFECAISSCASNTASIVVEGNDASGNGYAPPTSTARQLMPYSAGTASSTDLLSHSSAPAQGARDLRASTPDLATTDLASAVAVPTTSDDGITARVAPASVDTQLAQLVTVRLSRNTTSLNADRGIDALGVSDGGGNVTRRDHNPVPCTGVVCRAMP